MLKKTLLATALAAATSGVAFADSSRCCPQSGCCPAPQYVGWGCDWHNFYVGIEGGDSISTNIDLRPNFKETNRQNEIIGFVFPENSNYVKDIGSSGFMGAKLGYTVNPNVNLELSYDHRSTFEWEVLSSLDALDRPPGVVYNNEIYQAHDIEINTLLFDVKLNPNIRCGCLLPYANVGVGAAWNKLGTVQNLDVANVATYNMLLEGKTSTNFAWDVGVGVDYVYTRNLHFNLGYRFVSAGKLESTNRFVDTVSQAVGTITPLKAENVYLNEALVGVTWHFA